MLAQKPQPALSRAGRIKKNGSEASTAPTIRFCERAITL
jgi:hypothetical protein